MTDNWEHPPDKKKVFGYDIKFPPNGKAIRLEKIQAFQVRWNTERLTFQQHVQNELNIH
jgi:hypothetical protein